MEPVENVLYLADSYKVTHYNQYPPQTTKIYSYFECRGGKFEDVCFFGLQYVLKRWMVGCVVNHQMIDEAKEFYKKHFTGLDVFNENGWRYIVDYHKGRLPLRIKAVPEGSVIPYKNVLFTVENTDPKVAWLTNWFETLLLQVWYPTTICTSSRYHKILIAKYLEMTSDSSDSLPYKLHDFGYRGSSSVESAAIGDAAHLVNFYGTDTVAGIRLCSKYYGCSMAGVSIPAAEHSTITSWKRENEVEAYRHLLQQYPNGLVSVVSDSYDLYSCVEKIWGHELKELVMQREHNGCVIIRPDSGDPAEVTVKVLEILAKHYPCRINSKGYKMLPDYLRVIQADGVSYESMGNVLEAMKLAGWSAENVYFGTGGSLLQRVHRDTLKCAFKCSFVIVDGEERPVFKQPITDRAKTSKRGRLCLNYSKDGHYETVELGGGDQQMDLLDVVFENGVLLREQSLDEIRSRAALSLRMSGFYKRVDVGTISLLGGLFQRCSISRKDYIFPPLEELDLEEKFVSGHGPGGQNVNKRQNCVFLRHVPTGLSVKVHDDRLLQRNRIIARVRLQEKLDQLLNGENSFLALKAKELKQKSLKAQWKRRKGRELKCLAKERQQQMLLAGQPSAVDNLADDQQPDDHLD
ncbi:Nicotinamide phosphoribosyltransferase [Trichinella pseudospiralis]|uniref:Nicotinamide phosphoribosyltransferase n=2 Tax=Trichinella pseudospiralis TaxID=6337 RepID=A0A0V1IQ62_TRIPS|nr:Nicotinamide phosphoribosyltransferase [Trichinella pseudospiralis]KRY90082.1 Nicotinamide phosphoribosyltransferase [Trichinella pseudospiralis]KRZ24684.1 Nicotinamide phosphoribosyltransferase [Trichinella pseudospiralis]